MAVKVSVCVTVKNRSRLALPDRVLELFPTFVDSLVEATDPEDGFELVVADWCSTDWPLEEWLPRRVGHLELQYIKIDAEGFSRGHGLNVAADRARSDILFFTDADMLVSRKVLIDGLRALERRAVCFPVVCYFLDPDHTRIWRPPGGYGNVFIPRPLFEAAGRWPEFYRWGAEDTVLYHEVVRCARVERPYMEELQHQWHPSGRCWKDRYGSSKRIVLGTGTGRCGTVSLARVLNAQPEAYFTHEFRSLPADSTVPPLIRWQAALDVYQGLLIQMLGNYAGSIIGDVGFYWLPFIEPLVTQINPDARVVCLYRDQAEVVESYMHKTRGRNHWMVHDGSRWRHDARYDACYPKYALTDKRAALKQFWTDYQDTMQAMTEWYPDNVRMWHMADVLNTEKGQREVLDFVGIPRAKQVLLVGQRDKIGQ